MAGGGCLRITQSLPRSTNIRHKAGKYDRPSCIPVPHITIFPAQLGSRSVCWGTGGLEKRKNRLRDDGGRASRNDAPMGSAKFERGYSGPEKVRLDCAYRLETLRFGAVRGT